MPPIWISAALPSNGTSRSYGASCASGHPSRDWKPRPAVSLRFLARMSYEFGRPVSAPQTAV
ncbi:MULTISPECIES: hypothetical protein [Methylomicrobium]|uniref:hypothetical protein n=1 Tax=Methylomicrobium TaxID=39773 RepID=UPI0012F6FEFC|nr:MULTISPECIES: hypothetical protein [Methylomicrobium]